jgi:hypothetical protein
MQTQYDVKYLPRAGAFKHQFRMGVILGSDVHGATSKDVSNIPSAEKFFRSLAAPQFISVIDRQRSVNGCSISVAGRVIKKVSVKDGSTMHHTVYVR